MNTLWQINKHKKMQPLVAKFTSAEQVVLDMELLPYDIQGTLAHGQMLHTIGVLSEPEWQEIQKGLKQILKDYQDGSLAIEVEDEDCHTVIENGLVELIGSSGKKIHTGRSRNDQVLTALRLLMKDKLALAIKLAKELVTVTDAFTKKYGELPMPGYTHMQKAMPSTVGLWAENFSSLLQDDQKLLKTAYELVDQSPLGSGAAYGVPIAVDRELTAKLLGFAKVQENSLACMNSRGKIELAVVQALSQVMLTLSILAEDLLLFTTSEFDFFKVDDSLKTGSSIMPQKKNLDVMELVRAKTHIVLGLEQQIGGIVAGLPSGYNRDMQETKKPLMEAFAITSQCLQVCVLVIQNLKPKKEKLEAAMTPELRATEKAYELVNQEVAFRDAYIKVKSQIEKGKTI